MADGWVWTCAALWAVSCTSLALGNLPRRLRLTVWLGTVAVTAVVLLCHREYGFLPGHGLAPPTQPEQPTKEPAPTVSPRPDLVGKPAARPTWWERRERAPVAWQLRVETTANSARLTMTGPSADRHIDAINRDLNKTMKRLEEAHGAEVADFIRAKVKKDLKRADELAQGRVVEKIEAIDILLHMLEDVEFMLHRD